MPPTVEWFANIDNLNTRRAYENDVRYFAAFIGIRSPDDMRKVTARHRRKWYPRRGLMQNREHFPIDENSPLAITQYIKNVFGEFEIGTRDDDDPATSYPMVALLAHSDGRI